jgi:putative tricarboxylic transport membrane protein
MEHKSKLELVFNFLLLALGLYVIVVSYRIGFGTLREPDAGFFPFVGGLVILITDILVLTRRSKEEESVAITRSGFIQLLLFTILCVFWIMAMPYLGYVVVTFVIAFGLFKTMKLEGWGKPLLFSILLTLFIYLMFDYWFYLDLPRGILG